MTAGVSSRELPDQSSVMTVIKHMLREPSLPCRPTLHYWLVNIYNIPRKCYQLNALIGQHIVSCIQKAINPRNSSWVRKNIQNEHNLSLPFQTVSLLWVRPIGLFQFRITSEIMNHRHTVGLLGRLISSSQGVHLQRTTQQRQTRTNIHALSGIRTCECSRPAPQTARPLDRLFQILVQQKRNGVQKSNLQYTTGRRTSRQILQHAGAVT
jgi:hypothetical protein